MLKGECNCGAIRFEVTTRASGVYVCHCSICRRHTGANGNSVLVLDNDEFNWIDGRESIATWKKPGHDWQIWFCAICGSQVPGHNDDSTMFIPAGLLTEGGDDLRVIHHIWVDSKASWDEIGDLGRQHKEAFDE
ncbi:MAG: GFA family protein [Congregibacter sp.]